jgi:hypothetical protein
MPLISHFPFSPHGHGDRSAPIGRERRDLELGSVANRAATAQVCDVSARFAQPLQR